MKSDLYVKSLLAMIVMLLAVIAFRLTPAMVRAAGPIKYELAWFDPGSNLGEDQRKTEDEKIVANMINAETAKGWEFVSEFPYVQGGNTIVMFLVFKR